MRGIRSMYQVVVTILQPYTLLILLTWVGLALLWWRRPRESRLRLLPLTLSFAALTLISVPAVDYPLLGSLEWRYPPLRERPADAEAIVVLSGSYLPPVPYRPQPVLGETTLYRCLEAADLYHRGAPCPVLPTGGKVHPDSSEPSCAEVMGAFLNKLGVSPSDLIIEGCAQSTYENAVYSAELLSRRRIRKILLATDATHMYRAASCFRKQGLEVVPAACRHWAVSPPEFPRDFVPSPEAANAFLAAAHEWMGIVWYWLHGRI